ncbi:MAG: hypothetical protein ACE5QW_03525 [Thermoplasmata archaeon]
MTYYLLSPCKTTAAFMSTLKKRVKLDLKRIASLLRKRNFEVTDAGPLLVAKREVELTLYGDGKMIAKTDDRELADKSVREVYSLILSEYGESG